ncbi:DUF92 domain-containing protein [Spirochaeta dissipatitropha]
MILSSNIWGLILSYAGIFGIIAAAQMFVKKGMSTSATRKLIHISVCHWWLLALLMFDSLAWAIIGPISFIIINYISYRFTLFRSMEHPEKRKNLGTIYFPVSLTILVTAVYSGFMPAAAASIGILSLGWGDGLGALIGEHLSADSSHIPAILRKKYRLSDGSTKSVAGSLAVFAGSFVVALLTLTVSSSLTLFMLLLYSVILALLTSLIEGSTPYGLDNISIPLIVSLAAWGLLGLPEASNSSSILNGNWPVLLNILSAAGLNAAVALSALKKNAVSRSGAAAGFFLGFLLAVLGGWEVWILLMWFFLSATIIGRIRPEQREAASEVQERGSKREWIQVFANAGASLVWVIVYALLPEPVFLAAAAAGFSAATADTWSSEIGVLSRQNPVLITSIFQRRQQISPGLSGGVTILGTVAGMTGAIGTASLSFVLFEGIDLSTALLIAAAGFAGTLLDSILGATIQAQYRDLKSSLDTERQGTHNPLVRGFNWCSNDAVNAIITTVSSVLVFLALFRF